MCLLDNVDCELSKTRVDGHLGATPFLSVEDVSHLYVCMKHLFEAECLGADLNLISPVLLRFAAFVFQGDDLADVCRLEASAVEMGFDDVADTREVEAFGADGERAEDADTRASLIGPFIGLFVQNLTFGGEPVFGPDLLIVDQGTLLRAEQVVLKCGERDDCC